MGRGLFFARLLRSLADCLGLGKEPPSADNDTHRTALVQWPRSEVPNRNVPDFESDTVDSYTCASHPAHLIGHLSCVAPMIETTDRVCGDINSNDKYCRPGLFSENLKGVDTHQEEEGEREMEMEGEGEREVEMEKEKELGKKLARETKREMQRKEEMQREMESVMMSEVAAARRRQIIARVAAARSERKKALAMTVSKQLEMEKERVRADAVGASLVAEEEAQPKGKAEKTKKVQPKKKKKKAKEMKKKALKKVQSKGATWQPVTMVKADEAATKAATLAAEEAKAEEVMERLRAAERAFGLRARGRAVWGGEGGAPKGKRGVEGESKCYLDAVVQGQGVRQSPKASVARGVHPKDCQWPGPPEAFPTFSPRP